MVPLRGSWVSLASESFDVTVNVGGEIFTFPFLWLHEEGPAEISVTQQGTSSISSNPYTRFVGTAPAGTHVLATSEYGSADLEVGESGEFSLKVVQRRPRRVHLPDHSEDQPRVLRRHLLLHVELEPRSRGVHDPPVQHRVRVGGTMGEVLRNGDSGNGDPRLQRLRVGGRGRGVG